ncbi:MAG: hypothetical protein EZS28_016662 [Streblomastix strix]|uniref:Uncharacterized protein n=1 Tax=Streblomastix strix TaxID=222440 RepID=A0A5J4VYR1_9EUKA|nr:MAG: hypothetical protein EZS28_016662 [Streblomastix strix]
MIISYCFFIDGLILLGGGLGAIYCDDDNNYDDEGFFELELLFNVSGLFIFLGVLREFNSSVTVVVANEGIDDQVVIGETVDLFKSQSNLKMAITYYCFNNQLASTYSFQPTPILLPPILFQLCLLEEQLYDLCLECFRLL